MIRKIASALLAVLLMTPIMAEAAAFPDLGYLLNTQCQVGRRSYAFSQTFTCDVYSWAYPQDWQERFDRMLPLLAVLEGWTYQAAEVEGYPAYEMTGPAGEYALLVPRFDGQVLLLLPEGCELVSLEPTPDPTQAPDAAKPAVGTTAAPAGRAGGHYEWQDVTKDCPYCTNGRCRLCNGTGTYRLYGQAVDCDRYCSACDGAGTITQRSYVFILD